jgi:hypothetical protein
MSWPTDGVDGHLAHSACAVRRACTGLAPITGLKRMAAGPARYHVQRPSLCTAAFRHAGAFAQHRREHGPALLSRKHGQVKGPLMLRRFREDVGRRQDQANARRICLIRIDERVGSV